MKCLFFLTGLVFLSCASPPPVIPEQLISTGFGFALYSEKGFLFTPDKYLGDYKSIGLVYLTYTPGARLTTKFVSSYTGSSTYSEKEWVIEEFDPARVIEEVYNICVEMGADAMTQLDIEPFAITHGESSTKRVTISGMKISGFAIKRLGAFK